MVRRPSRAGYLSAGQSTALLFSYHPRYGMDDHFTGLYEKVHRAPKHLKKLRLQMAIKVLSGIPFLKNPEFILIFHALAKVAA